MKKRVLIGAALAAAALGAQATAAVPPPAPYGAVPSARQLRWQEMGMYAFMHFGVNTFTNKEWGYGDEDPSIFNPTHFDPDQILEALKAAGMKGVILTCKHHDGFCLWPTASTGHSVRSSSWMGGNGDVVKAISDACRRHGLKFGVYLSPWDRSNAAYGTPAYITLYRQQLRELLTHYGPLFEVWFDGANGGDGYYGGARETRNIDRKTYYDWPGTWAIVRKLQPNAVIFSDVGPDIRWVGNESGYANETCWETYRPVGENGGPAAPGDSRSQDAGTGTRSGDQWLPAECDVSIRPGWFYHAGEDSAVKTPEQLLTLYFRSVGRGASFLLNVPPDRRGMVHEQDVASLKRFGEILKATFKKNLAAGAKLAASNIRGNDPAYGPANLIDGDRYSYWATDENVTTPELVLDLGKDVTFNVIRLRENIKLGQRIEGFTLDSWHDGTWRPIAAGTSVGACRLIRTPEDITTSKVRLRITQCPVCPALSDFGLFEEPKI